MNLVIGNTSQLAQYFPEDYIRISSRNINLNEYVDVKYDSVYITFAEQRTYDTNISQDEFININVTYTSYIICLLYTSPSPRDGLLSRMPSSA